jgi:uncharacterized membrane protein YbhN (UPF0104 family)
MMQDKELSTPKAKTSRPILLWIGKLVVTVLILSYIFKTFRNEQKGIGDIGVVFQEILTSGHFPVIFTMLILVPVNWAMESLKWQKLAQKIIPIGFWEAFRGTLTGLAVGVAVPAQLGDTLGRVASLKSDRRLEAIGAALISNGIQFYVSVLAGTIGWLHLRSKLAISTTTQNAITALLALIIVLGIVTVAFRKPLTDWHPQRKVFRKLHNYLKIIGNYTGSELALTTLYGLIRYMIFLTQFILALSLFDFPVGYDELASCVTLIFLAKTLIPAVNVLGDLGLREFTALVVFASYGLPAEKVIAATFLVWIINVLGPILVGIFLIWKYKWKRIKF